MARTATWDAIGQQTAAQCATALGSTASNCSYHLRALGRVGLVEPVESTDGRERPWRATATGLQFTSRDASEAAALAVEVLALARDEKLTRSALARHPGQPPGWHAAEAYNTYGLRLTASELRLLVEQIDRLVRPYIGATRSDPPEDADVAHLRLLAFRHPQSP